MSEILFATNFKGHMVDSPPMQREKKMHRMMISIRWLEQMRSSGKWPFPSKGKKNKGK